jgi:release factor glutamine methyltransferase
VRSETIVKVAEALEAAASRLRAARVPKPRREANRLWAWVSRASPGEAYLARVRAADAELFRGFEELVTRRAAGEPLAYVLGIAGFRHLDIQCDRRALIPRPETEGVIDHALRRVHAGRALDLGAGSGCLALALAQEGEFAEVVGVDNSEEALALAAANGRAAGLTVRWVLSDFGVGLPGERFDLIVSNPPYLTEAEYAALDPAVSAWEPRNALVSGVDGLDATRRILREAGALLLPGGWLVMELDSTRSAEAGAQARTEGWDEISVGDDLFGRPRYLTARKGQSR